jgi:hypothetical protein
MREEEGMSLIQYLPVSPLMYTHTHTHTHTHTQGLECLRSALELAVHHRDRAAAAAVHANIGLYTIYV